MRSMTAQERYEDISKISGMSEDVVRAVLKAERESIINSLKRGERATLPGRCVIRPEIRSKLELGGKVRKYIRLKAEVATAITSQLADLDGFEEPIDYDDLDNIPDVRIKQIPSLG